ncbi:MAG: hypothetical protein KBG15_04675 [Kofleriaceae bacterium]|nr:hypothetical protein [Kofleriaceae bacterium]
MKLRCAALSLVATMACASAEPRVALVDTWPTLAPAYDAAYQTWTRHGELHDDYQQVIIVDATLHAPAWRMANVARARDQANQNEAVYAKALADSQADAAAHHRISVVVTTWDRRENNLTHGAQAAWHMALSDDAGHTWTPTSVVQDRRSEHVLRADYPTLRDFSAVYIATFDGSTKLLGNGAKNITLRVYGARGAVDVHWRAP